MRQIVGGRKRRFGSSTTNRTFPHWANQMAVKLPRLDHLFIRNSLRLTRDARLRQQYEVYELDFTLNLGV